ncbi:MAG: DNA topoisomerase, partial [Flavobacteriales bacterium]
KSSYGEDYAKRRIFPSKTKGAQEAHEAIRPTEMATHKIEGERNEERLYDLIWKRTLASQMSDAQLEKTTASVGISTRSELLVAKGEVIKFEGFLKVYLEGTDDENEEDSTTKGMLPPLSVGQNLELAIMNATQRFNHHPARYTEASLVKKLEELGIGRPSTYAPTIGTIQKRGYAVKEDRDGKSREYQVMTLKDGKYTEETLTEITGTERGKLFPTDIGIVVNDFLVEHFGDILDYSFTASVEKEFDDIANGELIWNDMIKKFYKPFHNKIETTLEHSERASGERILGDHPESGKVVLVRIGRFGPMAQIGDSEDEEKRFASLLPDQSITSITLEEALDLFRLPRTLGDFEGKTVAAAIGRFGPYVRHDSKFVSIKEADGDNPFSISLERAVELILAKREKDAKAILRTFDEDPEIRVLEGRWGPYIKAGKDNVKIPKGTEHTDLSFDEINALVEEHRKNPPKKRRKK